MANPPSIGKTFNTPRNDDTSQRLEWKIARYLAAGLGLGGVVTASGTKTGTFWIFHALSESVVTVVYGDGTSQTGITVGAGDRIFGDIRSLTLTSGTGELYNAVD